MASFSSPPPLSFLQINLATQDASPRSDDDYYGFDALCTSTLLSQDGVCVFTSGYRSSAAPKNNLFVDTEALSVQSALWLFSKYLHLFKDSHSWASASGSSQSSKKAFARCTKVVSLETEVTEATDLLFCHPFKTIINIVANAQRKKSAPGSGKVEHKPKIKSFLEELVALPACFNVTNPCFTNLSYIKALDDFDFAAQELWKMVYMTKNEQDSPYTRSGVMLARRSLQVQHKDMGCKLVLRKKSIPLLELI
jgi:hypothetical protein